MLYTEETFPFPKTVTKPAHKKIRLTKEQKQEFDRCKTDYMYFISNYVWVRSNGRVQFKPHKYQEELIHAYHNYDRVIGMIARQLGKTEATAAYILWYCMFNRHKEVLILSNTANSATEVLDRIRFMYEHCPDFLRAGVYDYPRTKITFDTKSRIITRATSASSARGLSPTIVYTDEFVFVPKNISEEFYSAIIPALSQTKGKLFMTSTPMTEFDLFSQIWRGATRYVDDRGRELPEDGPGYNGFKAVFATWRSHPDRTEEWAEKERLTMEDDAKFDREYNCIFAGYSETLIESKVLSKITHDVATVKPIYSYGGMKWYERPSVGNTYIAAWDPAAGTGADFAAIQVFKANGFTQVAEWMDKYSPLDIQLKHIYSLLKSIEDDLIEQGDVDPQIYWTFENNGLGQGIWSLITQNELEIPGTVLHEPKKRGAKKKQQKGLNTNGHTKLQACVKLKNLIEKGKCNLRSKELVRQLSFFVASGNSFAAKLGEKDDLVMALVCAARVLDRVAKFDENIKHHILDDDDFHDENVYPPAFII